MTAPLALLVVTLAQSTTRRRAWASRPLEQQQEERVQKLGKQLRCAVCQGVAIADSPSSMARAQLDKVRELVKDGKTDQEIYDFFVSRYGEWILMEPTKAGLNAVLWVGPVLLLLFGISVVVLLSRRQKGAADVTFGTTAAEPNPSAPPPAHAEAKPAPAPAMADDDPFLAQVRADLEK